ncbi:MAG: hypothetical protein IKN27_07010, partial [Selenomonadaceae bacterium]|nr:hypothetical protein [Selenomonadaceae bacterium]
MSNQSQVNLSSKYKVARIGGIKTPFFFRPINEDICLIHSIFESEEYALPIENFQPKLILDCGGNIGCS